MIRTSLSVPLEKLDITKSQLAEALSMRRAWFTDFDKGRMRRIHLDVIQRIIDHAADKGIALTIADFFTDSD